MGDQFDPDPATMQAAITQLVGLVTGLQGEVQRLATLQATPPAAQAAPAQAASSEVPNIQDDELLDRFVRGLKPRTRMEVTMREPATFEDAVKLADRMDSLFSPGFGLDRQPKGRSTTYTPVPILSRPASNPVADPVPMEIDALRRRLLPLTDAERDRLRKIGGCFRCRQTGHIATNCPLGTSSPAQNPRVNQAERSATPTEHPDLIDFGPEPRLPENFTPQ
ncbi:hypothetical protein KFL_010010040 [Klebsormidium nitens]|uniref:CCHC-type domain-containing protein n=1 Tax=Klebsormidium nitens TaxID=105231 RepID=A0A1Y1IU84_KLENI|nr:hypothetical protein KFL_010010040 [Klebsormidium nitens]|eukprot:GAQ92386.1 hypothetical protein KFL_010010040 [Klebsormidium nitens]